VRLQCVWGLVRCVEREERFEIRAGRKGAKISGVDHDRSLARAREAYAHKCIVDISPSFPGVRTMRQARKSFRVLQGSVHLTS
jgi:hypothetical protein